ncbi:xylulokinase [Erwinia phyllosphaerae]|uniref:xylulokinase n=1 Tax=Erwinia phyllosphaerae TaxID=2853256 RepID=UPI001FEF62C2|nr:xylulokinase [Erwinia phyllosphaerae]MBV4365315.1 xylulokinase [Erwinia phyllosphaerae]
MYIGIDLGTSGVKAVLLDENNQVLASHTEQLTVSRPHPLWSEQDPEAWWQATDKVMLALAAQRSLRQVRAIGLSGQMHGAVLLGRQQQILRPAILWNDGRSARACQELEECVPDARSITGNLMMPGFTAPKLLWVKEHEADIYRQIARVLLPKDYLRWRMTGEFASDMSDAAGTMWLDVARRDWSDRLLAACGLSREQMPTLFEGNQVTGQVAAALCQRWSLPAGLAVVAGGGDNAAGAIGAGIWQPGQAMLSLGTSGVYFAVSERFLSNPERAVHSFCHALPDSWHLMSVMLSAAACLDWATRLTGQPSVAALLALAEKARLSDRSPCFLPHLSGERTPYNNPAATGVFWGFTHQHGPEDLAMAVLEGVSLGLLEGMEALHASGIRPSAITLIGGGARSAFWRQLLADISGEAMDYRTGGDVGPALGAARLARMSCYPGVSPAELLPELPLEARYTPRAGQLDFYRQRQALFKQLYQQTAAL